MKYFFTIIFFISLSFTQNYEDVVELKDGSVIKGIIIETKPNEYIKIKSGENIFVYQINQINIIKEDDNNTNPYYMSLNSSIMPDLSKMELMDAIALLENFGMKVIIQGKGKKINQSIKKGKRIKKNQKIILRLTWRQ